MYIIENDQYATAVVERNEAIARELYGLLKKCGMKGVFLFNLEITLPCYNDNVGKLMKNCTEGIVKVFYGATGEHFLKMMECFMKDQPTASAAYIGRFSIKNLVFAYQTYRLIHPFLNKH